MYFILKQIMLVSGNDTVGTIGNTMHFFTQQQSKQSLSKILYLTNYIYYTAVDTRSYFSGFSFFKQLTECSYI